MSVIADAVAWWDRYGNLDKFNKINEMIAQIKNLRYLDETSIGTTDYWGDNTNGRKETSWITKSGMALATWVTICRLPTNMRGLFLVHGKESGSSSYTSKVLVGCTTTIGYGVQEFTAGASNSPWNAGTTTYRIVESGGYYLFEGNHTKYYAGSTTWLMRGWAHYQRG